MILTSNRGFAEWGEVFGDPVVATALLDRLLHHAVVIQIEGARYRMREHAALVPENVRNGAAFNPPPQKRRGRPPLKGKPISNTADHCAIPNRQPREFWAPTSGLSRTFGAGQAITRARRRSKPARPYMDRLMSFSLLIVPSTGPVLHGRLIAARTASKSRTRPRAKDAMGFSSANANHPSRVSALRSTRTHGTGSQGQRPVRWQVRRRAMRR